MFNRVFVIFNFFVLIIFAISAIPEFMLNHTYYNSMMTNFWNWILILDAILFSLIPVGYLVLSKKRTLVKFLLSLFAGLYFFGLTFISIKGDLLGSGAIMWLINVGIVMLLSSVFVVGLLALGIYIREKIFKINIKTIYDIVITFGFGLVMFILINYILIVFSIYYTIIAWLILLGLCVLIYLQRERLKEIQDKLFSCFDGFRIENLVKSPIGYIGIALLIFTIVYYFYGFLLSYIPYPTAWDANHAYLFFPKMWAHHGGYTWHIESLMTIPYLWYGYLVYWFALFVPFDNSFWISSNTFAVELNFLSGIFVMLFGLALVRELIDVVKMYLLYDIKGVISLDDEKSLNIAQKLDSDRGENSFHEKIIFYLGRFFILLWLTSGMGAFLVFVDNKTDLGVLTLIIFAIYSGLVFIKKVYESEGLDLQKATKLKNQDAGKSISKKNNLEKISRTNDFDWGVLLNKEILFSLLSSGFFFAIAAMAKPTALLDAVNFGMLLFGLWLGVIGILGVFLFIIGLLAALKYPGIGDYIDKGTGKRLLAIGGLIAFIDPIRNIIANSYKKLIYILIWGLTFFLTILILKGPFILSRSIIKHENKGVVELLKNTFLSKSDTINVDELIQSDKENSYHHFLNKNSLLAGTQDVYLETNKTTIPYSGNTVIDIGEFKINTGNTVIDIGEFKTNTGNTITGDYTTGLLNTGSVDNGVLITGGINDTLVNSGIEINTNTNESIIVPNIEACNSTSASIGENQDLYNTLEEPEGDGYSEDVGRYVGYGRRKFEDPSWGMFFPLFDKNSACYGFDKDALILCENENLIINNDVEELSGLLLKLKKNKTAYLLLSGLLNTDLIENENKLSFNLDKLKEVNDYIENNSIKVLKICYSKEGNDVKKISCDIINNNKNYDLDPIVPGSEDVNNNIDKKIIYGKEILVPYNFLKIFNITFNWSLQNHSSYYTDIGFIWLLLTVFILVSLLYGIGKMNKVIISLSLVSIFGWTIWFYIGGGILWYGIGLVVWTIMNFLVYMYFLYDKDDLNFKYVYYFFVSLILVLCFYQLFLNFARISSQGGGGPFMWYKTSNGTDIVLDDELKAKKIDIFPYNWQEVFKQQFGHYNKFLDLANNRQEGEGIMLAGTYARYFVKDQQDIKYDQMLVWLMKMFSDGDICRSYLRLKDNNIRYLAIDPNIGTVVMGGGNMSLFHRFFAKISPDTGKIEKDGTITMLLKMKLNGYLDYISSNNIGLKYAFVVSDSEINTLMGGNANAEDIFMMRARLATARFWMNNNLLQNMIVDLSKQRVLNGQFLGDIADVYGKVVDENKLMIFVSNYFGGNFKKDPSLYTNMIKELDYDEKFILKQYIQFYNILVQEQDNYDQIVLQEIVAKSVNSSSQILVLDVK